MRRVMVTPTFAAGLGVVIATVLVYPMSRMVFSYGAKCQFPACGSGTPGGGSSAQPGKQMGRGAGPAPLVPSASPGKGKFPPGQPVLSYLTMTQDNGSFTGQILMKFQARSVPATWVLWISYPSGRIVAVSGAEWQADTDHSAEISGGGVSGARQLKVVFTVDSPDPGAPPAGCAFNGKTCHFVAGSTVSGSTAAGSVNDVSASPFNPGRDAQAACGAVRGDRGRHGGRSLCHRKTALPALCSAAPARGVRPHRPEPELAVS
jgi:hypothetical protein